MIKGQTTNPLVTLIGVQLVNWRQRKRSLPGCRSNTPRRCYPPPFGHSCRAVGAADQKLEAGSGSTPEGSLNLTPFPARSTGNSAHRPDNCWVYKRIMTTRWFPGPERRVNEDKVGIQCAPGKRIRPIHAGVENLARAGGDDRHGLAACGRVGATIRRLPGAGVVDGARVTAHVGHRAHHGDRQIGAAGVGAVGASNSTPCRTPPSCWPRTSLPARGPAR